MYKKYIAAGLSTFTLCTMLLTFIITANRINETQSQYVNAANSKISEAPLYIIKELDGYAAIYVPTDNKLVEKTDIDLRTLTNADQLKISHGVNIYNQTELTSFLEDFGS